MFLLLEQMSWTVCLDESDATNHKIITLNKGSVIKVSWLRTCDQSFRG